jgi:predicted DCC family thiol-disulfide oxidoreductase YuxK
VGEAIVYFDGVCNLCNRFVDFLVRHDRKGRYRFASLQGETARRRLPHGLTGPAPETIVLESSGELRFRSDAALAILSGLGGAWRAFGALRVVPRPLRDWVYQWIARNRFRWFGRRDTCRVPGPKERSLFLN